MGEKNIGANWSDFSGSDEYHELKKQLIHEQGNHCCYCEVALKKNSDSHVEHFKPKDRYPIEMFNSQNLFACCQQSDSCGHKKGSNYFTGLVSPLDSDCQTRFTYTGRGEIIPNDENDADADKTIKILGLNCKRLVDRRSSLIKTLDYECTEFQMSLDNCIEWHDGFYSVIDYLYQKTNPSDE